jgi:hypothetical protein
MNRIGEGFHDSNDGFHTIRAVCPLIPLGYSVGGTGSATVGGSSA